MSLTAAVLRDVHHRQILSNANGQFDAFGKTENARADASTKAVSRSHHARPDWQRHAQEAANEPYREAVPNPDYKQTPDTAIVSVDNTTGAIRTMLSGRNYNKDQLNLADASRQPGSAFKPFTLVAAFREGVPPGSVFSTKSPLCLPEVDEKRFRACRTPKAPATPASRVCGPPRRTPSTSCSRSSP